MGVVKSRESGVQFPATVSTKLRMDRIHVMAVRAGSWFLTPPQNKQQRQDDAYCKTDDTANCWIEP